VKRTPGTSALPDVPTLESDSDSEGEVEDSLEPPSEEQAGVSKLCREGGAALSHFLLAESITTSVAGNEDEVLLNSPKVLDIQGHTTPSTRISQGVEESM